MEEEDTIELIDLLRVVWKWKWFIIIFTFLCAIGAGIISFAMPKIYEVSMMIGPGVINVDEYGKPVAIDSPSDIKSKIDSKAYNREILKRLDADPEKRNLNFKTVQPKNSNTVSVSLEAKDVNKGIRSLSTLFHELIKEYQSYIDIRKFHLDQEIAKNKRQLEVGAGEKNNLEHEITAVKINTDKIIEERNALLQNSGTSPDKLSLLIYANIIQQNMTHYHDLKKELSDLMGRIEEIKSNIESLQIKKQSIENIKLIQEPRSSINPVKPKKKLNVMLAFVVGFFFSIFLSFFIEYIKNVPKATQDRG
ncbi:MAG: Wzz/FepE/Etk N-terminal domain-containing protein [Desulfatiglandales bacterium]